MGFVIWGQFLDHDLDLTTAGKEEAFNIEIPPFDEFFQNQEHLNFHRSHFVTGS